MVCLSPVSFVPTPVELSAILLHRNPFFQGYEWPFVFWQFQNGIICCYRIQTFSSISHSLWTLILFPLPCTRLCFFLPCWLLLLSLYWWFSFWWFSKQLGSTKGSVLNTFSLLAFSPWLISSSLMALNSICAPESSIIIITANQGWVLTMCQALHSKCITLV